MRPLILGALLLLPACKRSPGIEWIAIPGGSFTMGGDFGHELPRHKVTVPAFEMAKSEVTFAQYQRCVDAGACVPAHIADGTCADWDGTRWTYEDLPASFLGADQPVVCVNWAEAKAYCEWAGARLPSEAEWEYAARGVGKERIFPWGDQGGGCEHGMSGSRGRHCESDAAGPVCSKPKGNTALGLCDMTGGVWEWMQDWYHWSYKGAPTDGSAWETDGRTLRVMRGGSWGRTAGDGRAAARNDFDGEGRQRRLGFRPVRRRPG